jgi:hypothetical protein
MERSRERAQLEAIAALMALRPPRVLFGGWAEDALLHGKPSRPHEDIDLLVPLPEIAALVDQVADLGFRDPRVKFQVEPDKPIVVAAYRDGIELELIVYQVDAAGRAYFDLPVGDDLQRMWLPEGAFDHSARLGSLAVRTLTPLALHQVREFCKEVFGGFREKDRVTQAALKARYFPSTPEGQLRPRVEP